MISVCSCPDPGRMAVTPRRLVPPRPPRRPRLVQRPTVFAVTDCLRGGVGEEDSTAHFFEDERVSAVQVSDLVPDMVSRHVPLGSSTQMNPHHRPYRRCKDTEDASVLTIRFFHLTTSGR